MKIQSIDIKNFQKHRNLHIDVSPGITAITGTSDKGKTSVMRAVCDWLLNNRPQGFAFRHLPSLGGNSQPIKDNECTSVRITMDNGQYVERRRDNLKTNCYDLNGKIYEALRGDVPKEVLEFLNIAPHCVQRQHEPHFLLSDSSGEVAKKINNLVGLDEIDRVTKNINETVSSLKKEVDRTEKQIQDNTKELEKYAFVGKAERLVDRIHNRIDQITELQNNIDQVEHILSTIVDSESEIDGINEWLAVEKPYSALIQRIDSFQTLRSNYDTLCAIDQKIDDYNNELGKTRFTSETESLLDSLTRRIEAINMEQTSFNSLMHISNQIDVYEKQVDNISKDIEAQQKWFIELLGDVCPLCNQPIQGTII